MLVLPPQFLFNCRVAIALPLDSGVSVTKPLLATTTEQMFGEVRTLRRWVKGEWRNDEGAEGSGTVGRLKREEGKQLQSNFKGERRGRGRGGGCW